MKKTWIVAAALWGAARVALASGCVDLYEGSAQVGGDCDPAFVIWETTHTGVAATTGGSWLYAAAGSVDPTRGRMGSYLHYTTVAMDHTQPIVHVDTKLADTLVFTGAGGSGDVTFEVALHGAFVAQMRGSIFNGRLMFKVGASEAWLQMVNDDPSSPMGVFGKVISAVPEIEVQSTLPEDTRAIFRLTVPVAAGTPVSMSALLQLQVAPMDDELARADFDHTATLAIRMPAGWSFTSQSGLLLVPEPPAALLMALGTAALALARRRR